jgi:hypothetical protein
MKQKQWLEMKKIVENHSSLDEINKLIEFIEKDLGYQYNSDRIIHYPLQNKCEIFFCEKLIAIIDKNKKVVEIPNFVYKNKAIKLRINRILMRFCGVNFFKKKDIWYIKTPTQKIKQVSSPFVVSFFK